MARIACFTDALTTPLKSSSRLAHDYLLDLAEAQHDVKVFTERLHTQDFSGALEIAQPFRKWSVFELLRTLPSLAQFRPQLILIIESQNAPFVLDLLPSLVPSLPAAKSLFVGLGQNREWSQRHAVSLMTCHAIVSSSNELLHQLRVRLPETISSRLQQIAPPRLRPAWPSAMPPSETWKVAWARFQKQAKHIALLPGTMFDHDLSSLLTHLQETPSDFTFVCAGGWGSVPIQERLHFLKSLSEQHLENKIWVDEVQSLQEREFWIETSNYLWIASLSYRAQAERIESMRHLQREHLKPIFIAGEWDANVLPTTTRASLTAMLAPTLNQTVHSLLDL